MDETRIGTPERPLRVAVVGSGPSGFFAAEELLTRPQASIEVDLFDRLPTPFGLVRGGVAPDHQKIKSVVKVYDRTAARTGFRFFGHVEFGRDLTLEEARRHYDAVLFAVGAKSDRRMGIPGEDLKGSEPATAFVGWYNGHPDYVDCRFDLSSERVAVVGNGNVAMDVTRILATDPKQLENTDIAGYALDALRKSRVQTIYLLGRRGPAQASFTNPEIRELCELPGADLVVDPKEVELDPLSAEDLKNGVGGPNAKNNVRILTEQSKKGEGPQSRKIVVRFLASPVELVGKDGKVSAIKLERNELRREKDGSLRPHGTGRFETLPVGLVLRSVGYKGVPVAGLPFDERRGTIPNDRGRVVDPATKQALPGLYVAGWAKRGPSGVIGTNKPDAIETVQNLLADLLNKPGAPDEARLPEAVERTLREKGVPFVDYADWKLLDELEVGMGQAKGKVREKFCEIKKMMEAVRGRKAAAGTKGS